MILANLIDLEQDYNRTIKQAVFLIRLAISNSLEFVNNLGASNQNSGEYLLTELQSNTNFIAEHQFST